HVRKRPDATALRSFHFRKRPSTHARFVYLRSSKFVRGELIKMRRLRSIKRNRNMITKASPLFLAFAIAAATQTAKAQQYQATFLDDLGGNSRGNSIN